MNDPNLDAWDRYCDQMEQSAVDEFEWWIQHKDRVLQLVCAIASNPARDGLPMATIIQYAIEGVEAIVKNCYDDNGDYKG